MGQYDAMSSAIRDFAKMALEEDLTDIGDVTTRAVFPPDTKAHALIRSKDSGVLSGVAFIKEVFSLLDSQLVVTLSKNDGDAIEFGNEIARVSGSIYAILAGERVVLNIVQRLSGIATATNALAKAVSHTKTRILDTRKTTPGMRLFEKQAVIHGGGCNHRIGLYDMILIKDTHVKASGGPGAAVIAARKGNTMNLSIEVEVQSINEFIDALAQQPTRIMLDNMSCKDMQACVEMRNKQAPKVELEASGNVSLETVAAIAETGVDFISSGAITHSVKALDIHLVID